MSEERFGWIVIGAIVVAGVAIFAMLARKALSKELSRLATSFGWDAPRRVWWSGAVRGRWQGFEAELQHMGRYKTTPERLLLTVKAVSPARVIVKLRKGGVLTKPLTLFAPPLVEPMGLANREHYWIRSNEPAFVERLFSNAEVAPALEPNLIAQFDVVDLQRKHLRILRAVDDRAVKKHFKRPLIKFRRDLGLIETIATEEWRLAVAIVGALGLRGYE